MLIRVRPPGYQVSLWLFLQNSAIGTVRRVGRACVEIADGEEARVAEAVTVWHGLNPLAEVKIESGP
jgi:hypothetical protein